MKITKVVENKDGSASMELEMNKEERDFMMELGVNEMIRVRLKQFEDNLSFKPKRGGVVNHEPPKPKKKRGGGLKR